MVANFIKSVLYWKLYVLVQDKIFLLYMQKAVSDVVVSVLETKCPHCGHWTGKYYEGFWDCPTTEICQVCGKSFGDLTAENSYLVWKVV